MTFEVMERNGDGQSTAFCQIEGFEGHVHLRDKDATQAVARFTAHQFGGAIVMPNLKPPVVNVKQALNYWAHIKRSLPEKQRERFTAYMTLYLTDNTDPEEIRRAKEAGILAVKYYPAGATTNSAEGVSDIQKVYKVLETMQKEGVVLCAHGEVTDPEVDIFDREAVFIDKKLRKLRRDFPALKMVLEHITTKQGVQYVMSADEFLAATLTCQHLLYNRNALFTGGFQPHAYCLPVLKSEEHRQALVDAVTSGRCKRLFAGTDSAPHAAHLKEQAGGHAGCFTANAAMEHYTEVFDRAGALEQLEAFTSFNGPDFYGIPRSERVLMMEKKPWVIEEWFRFGESVVK